MLLNSMRKGFAAFLLTHAAIVAAQTDLLLNKTYDYIVVGGGTSGLTIANRLTENGKRSVLVIEYGPLRSSRSISLPIESLRGDRSLMHNITSLPIPGLQNRTSAASVGAVVGGGSSVNGMFFGRGSAADYDAWERLGNPGWGWESMLKYFKKSVEFGEPSEEEAKRWNRTWDTEAAYGEKGPVKASFPPWNWPAVEYSWKAWDQLGIPRQREGAAGNATNLIHAPNSLDPVTRTRSDARAAHYEPYKNRSNYHLLPNHQVTEILFSNTPGNSTLQALGVHVLKVGSTGPKLVVRARHETILATGAIWTPWLLQRSGIGPKAALSAAGIPLLKDLPGVGANLQDHPRANSIFSFSKPPFPNPSILFVNKTFMDEAQREYEQNRTGIFTMSRGNQAAFLTLKTVDPNWAALVEQGRQQDSRKYLPSAYEDARLYKGFLRQKNVTLDLLSGSDAAAFEFPFNSGPISGVLQRPLSRGTITLNPSNPQGNPLVAYNTLQNPLDLQQSIAMFKYSRKIMSQPAFEPVAPVEVGPGANATTDEQIERVLRGVLLTPTFAHPSGTASMGVEEEGGVVDRELRVHGTGGLSVVDAGVMPVAPAGHLCATVYAVAEKAADLIKARTGWDEDL